MTEDYFEYFAWTLFDKPYDELNADERQEVASYVASAENDD